MWLSVWIKKKKIPQGLRGKEYTNQFSLQTKGAVTVEDYWTECQYYDIVWVCFVFGNCNHCCFCCGHPCTMLGVSLYISCKKKKKITCIKFLRSITVHEKYLIEFLKNFTQITFTQIPYFYYICSIFFHLHFINIYIISKAS